MNRKSAPPYRANGSIHGIVVMINEKPETPSEIKIASETAQIRQTMNMCSFFSPCLRTNAFCDPIAKIKPIDKEKPATKPFIKTCQTHRNKKKTVPVNLIITRLNSSCFMILINEFKSCKKTPPYLFSELSVKHDTFGLFVTYF